MTTTIPYKSNIPSGKKINQGSILHQQSSHKPSFKGVFKGHDEQIMKVFADHYGNIGEKIGDKLYKLASENEPDILRKSSRFTIDVENGALSVSSIKDKKVGRSLAENIIFPFVTLPLKGINAILEEAKNVSFLKSPAEKLYDNAIFRVLRGLEELDSNTDVLKGILDQTEKTISGFAEKKGVSAEQLIKILNKPQKDLTPSEQAIVKEADGYIKENLYKVSNKFFDKNTGNYNTAYERPLNRIVTGLIPAIPLGNDIYNLAIYCGDSEDEAKEEANKRMKQEVLRIGLTAYLQLLLLGAFQKQVNNSPWFAPVLTAGIVFVSEIYSRYKVGNPVFMLSEEEAKEYNKKRNQNKVKNAETKQPVENQKSVTENKKSENKKSENKNEALMNFDTFKKGVTGLTAGFLMLSIIKNSSLTKDSLLVKKFGELKQYLKDELYTPLAFKEFEIKEEQFKKIMQSLKDAGGEKIAEGHEIIKEKYSKTTDGIIRIYNDKGQAEKIPTKIKPFVDVVTVPFSFVYSAAKLPFKLLKSSINLMVLAVEKSAEKLGLSESKQQALKSNINRVLKEVFGEENKKSKSKTSQVVFVNAMEQFEKKTLAYRKAQEALSKAVSSGEKGVKVEELRKKADKEKQKLENYILTSVQKSFNGITQSNNKNTDLALTTKIFSSTVTSGYLVFDNYNKVMINSNGQDTELAKEKANERIVQRASGLGWQTFWINWFNQTFKSTYNKSLLGMAMVAAPNTMTTEYFMRASIGMPIRRKTMEELNEIDRENENKKGLAGKYFKFISKLTGKKPLKDRLPNDKQRGITLVQGNNGVSSRKNYTVVQSNKKSSTNVLEMFATNKYEFSTVQNNQTSKTKDISTNVLDRFSNR